MCLYAVSFYFLEIFVLFYDGISVEYIRDRSDHSEGD